MKKCLLTVVLVLVVSINAFAADFSVGITAGGWGPTFGRGDVWKDMIDSDGSKKYGTGFAPMAALVGQVDIIPFFAVELGVGYSMKVLGSKSGSEGTDFNSFSFIYDQITIPLLLKGQYEIADRVNIYLGVGPKFNFNLGVKNLRTIHNATINDSKEIKAEKEEYNMFDMDLSFALGAEYKIANAHYVGLRVGYDMNILGTMKEQDNSTGENKYSGRAKFFVDDLAISLTYRYKFGQ